LKQVKKLKHNIFPSMFSTMF